jgi:hypothetical protein
MIVLGKTGLKKKEFFKKYSNWLYKGVQLINGG